MEARDSSTGQNKRRKTQKVKGNVSRKKANKNKTKVLKKEQTHRYLRNQVMSVLNEPEIKEGLGAVGAVWFRLPKYPN